MTTPPTGAINLLTNPGFESQLQNWNSWGNSAAVTGHSTTGTYSARTGKGAGGVTQDVTSKVVAGGTYRFQAKAKIGNTSQEYAIGVFMTNAEGQTFFDQGARVTSTTYATHTVYFTVPANAVTVGVYTWKDAGTSYGYADDLTLVEFEIPPSAPNLLTNPGFESQLQNWNSWGNSSAVTGIPPPARTQPEPVPEQAVSPKT